MRNDAVINKKNGFAVALGRQIKERRLALKLTQEKLASLLGVEMNTVSRLECGSHLPSLERLEQIAHILNSSVGTLLGEVSSNHIDQANLLLAYLEGLTPAERDLVLSIAKKQSDFFKSRPK